ncbi:MAG: class I poly(R)-hydroxyalkanoic acid synthase [Pelagerythrobacter marensis]|nr:MAG: class I poly(R)-hydroxyalkanoic acid synthase [Pelagerythrobacter marensis]
MHDDPTNTALRQMMEMQARSVQDLWQNLMPSTLAPPAQPAPDMAQNELAHWAALAQRMQQAWMDFHGAAMPAAAAKLADPAPWLTLMEHWTRQLPFADPQAYQALWADNLALWTSAMGLASAPTEDRAAELPRRDRRFRDERWSGHPVFTLIHQTYLMMSERIAAMVDDLPAVAPDKHEQMRFATRAMLEALSPANFALTNPLVLEKTLETRGENLVRGMEHMLADMKRGQLTHTDPDAFKLGENLATTPGKVVHETPLYQLIQYTPTTKQVGAIPLVIFPPWINRFYILDLNPKKSFIRWAVEQGLTTFVVSWKSADASMADVVWDDYIAAQIEAIDHVRARLNVPSVHTIGYCVAGTTLAATLAVLAKKGEADKVTSATFFTAQVDFADAGELLHFIDQQQLASVSALAGEGYLDGRVMAATFNMLRGTDLIWNYVVNNYLLGEEYPAFDLLHWNGDVTNLPARWHKDYLEQLYRDNRLVEANSLEALGFGIDLGQVATPSYVQAGKEDHIAPADSVWKITRHFTGPIRFVLAGSGHIAGVVNPPDSGKYQYWTNDEPVRTLEEFRAGATEHPGSWWPDWIEWIRAHDAKTVAAKGKRVPGGAGDTVIEDAPGRYVMTR